jgi:protein-S-isoprenylcysteine O-methyltransferase Ste14
MRNVAPRMSLRERWICVIYRAATGTKRARTLLTPVGIAVFGGLTALFVAGAMRVDSIIALPGLLPESVRLLLAIPTLAVGLGFTGWSALHFLRAKGTPVPFNPPPRLVTSGPYRLSRNPMLTGVFLFLFGLGFAVNSVSLVLVFVPLFILANAWELKAIEEPELVRRLGDEYIEYRQRTPMFVPRIRRRDRSEDPFEKQRGTPPGQKGSRHDR